jgi:hypothetical protein
MIAFVPVAGVGRGGFALDVVTARVGSGRAVISVAFWLWR